MTGRLSIAAISGLALLSACAELPRDPDGTTDAVLARGAIRVGLTADTGALPDETLVSGRLLDRLSTDLGVRVAMERGATEPMLARLDDGGLDLVITPLDDETPWASRVGLGPALTTGTIGGRPHALRAAVKAGENDLLRRVWNASVAVGGTP